jgi:hypothetical protein
MARPHREIHPARGIERLHLTTPEDGENNSIVAWVERYRERSFLNEEMSSRVGP